MQDRTSTWSNKKLGSEINIIVYMQDRTPTMKNLGSKQTVLRICIDRTKNLDS